jgi:V/A-type H+-transporting ATPase subunit F
MRYFAVSDDPDLLVGLRLAGIPGSLAKTKDEAIAAVNMVQADPSIGILIVTEHLAQLCQDLLKQLKKRTVPLVVELPGRLDEKQSDHAITRSIREAIGMNR